MNLTIKRYGDKAILIEWKQEIDLKINTTVHQLNKSLLTLDVDGLENTIPAFASLVVLFDPAKINFRDLSDLILKLSIESQTHDLTTGNNWRIPVCYDSEFFWEERSLCDALELSRREIINAHTATNYRIFMMGFLPGFPYLGKLSEKLRTKRLSEPRKAIEAGSVAIADLQTGIYPQNSPGGWNVIGRTPLPLIHLKAQGNDALTPFLFSAGDSVSFYLIAMDQFKEIQQQMESGIVGIDKYRIND